MEDQKSKKKTRIKLIGKGWGEFRDFQTESQIIEVELLPDYFFIYNKQKLSYVLEGYEIEILPDEPAPEPEKPFEFRVGDKVKVPWSDEVYILQKYDNAQYPLSLSSYAGSYAYDAFSTDGKLDAEHSKSVLTLVERPKKTVKHKIEAWAVVSFNPKTGVVETVLRASEGIARKEVENANTIKSDLIFSYEWIGAKEIELCE